MGREEESPLIAPYEDRTVDAGFFHPTRTFFKWAVLLVISLICFGSYFTYDEIENLESYMKDHIGITHQQFGLLYTVYSIPNFILVFFGGILGDKVGLRKAGFLFVTLCVIGAAIIAIGPAFADSIGHSRTFIILCIGRVVFGCGAESLNVIQNSMITRWFSGGRELAFAMGLVLSMSRLGDFLAIFLAADIASWTGNYIVVLWIGTILCGVSFLAVIVYSIMDISSEKYFPSRISNSEENAVNFKAVLHFDSRFWLIAIVVMCYYGGIFPFVAICADFLETNYNVEPTTAGYYASIVTLASMCLSPILGKVIDITANRPYFVVFGSLAIIPCHMVLAFNLANPIIPIIIMGLSFSLVPSALWPSIPLITKPAEVATAFGLLAAIQNTGLAFINFLAGTIADSKYGYNYVLWFFVLMDVIGLICAVILVCVDNLKDRKLSEPKRIEVVN